MTSLRRRLLLSTGLAIAVVGLGCATVAYLLVSEETRTLLDDQLTQIARLAAQTVDGSEIPGRGDEDIVVSVWGADQKLKFSTATGLDLPLLPGGFKEVTLTGEPYRVYSTLIAGRHIAVAQPVDIRDDQAEAAALAGHRPRPGDPRTAESGPAAGRAGRPARSVRARRAGSRGTAGGSCAAGG